LFSTHKVQRHTWINIVILQNLPISYGYTQLRHFSTSRKVERSISDEVIEYFLIYLNFHTHHGPEVYSSSKRNEYHNIFSGVVNRGRGVRLITSPPSVCLLSRKFGRFNISQNSLGLHGLLQG
jgi:hypothetical protein